MVVVVGAWAAIEDWYGHCHLLSQYLGYFDTTKQRKELVIVTTTVAGNREEAACVVGVAARNIVVAIASEEVTITTVAVGSDIVDMGTPHSLDCFANPRLAAPDPIPITSTHHPAAIDFDLAPD